MLDTRIRISTQPNQSILELDIELNYKFGSYEPVTSNDNHFAKS